jgi:ferrochelatase
VLKHQRSLAVRSATAADAYTTFDENVKGVTSHAVEEKVGVLLFNLGGPETLNDVQPFLFNLFADPVSDRSTCS